MPADQTKYTISVMKVTREIMTINAARMQDIPMKEYNKADVVRVDGKIVKDRTVNERVSSWSEDEDRKKSDR